jgi:hypothetical protein
LAARCVRFLREAERPAEFALITRKPAPHASGGQPGEPAHGQEPPTARHEAASSDDCDQPFDLHEINPDDDRWEVFVPDDDERDPQPDYGDFWPEETDE